MRTTFLPSTDAGLLAWALNFNTLVGDTPTEYGLTAGQASQFNGAFTPYQSAYQLAHDPISRTNPAIEAKNDARKVLKAIASMLSKTVQCNPDVTNSQKSALGLTIPKKPSPTPVPSTSPIIEIGTVTGWTVNMRLHDSASSHRTRPAGVAGAAVFSFAGATPPADIAAWKFEANIGRMNKSVAFDSSLAAGSKVWLTAFWFNGAKQSGPACAPVSTMLQGGSVSSGSGMKIAA